MNLVMLTGHLGHDPEGEILETQTALCRMSVATNKTWTKNGEKQERTDWHRIVCFGPLANACMQFLAKGSHVAIQGELRTSTWLDDTGNNRRTVEVLARSIEFLDKRPPVTEPTEDDDIPF